MAHYAVGDIQGCFLEFIELLDKIQFDSNSDQLWLVGDLVNRGPQSLETLRFIKSLGNCVKIVLGNHDLHLLAVHYGMVKLSNEDTISDILYASDRDELITWLQRQPLLHYDAKLDFLMVHAGIAPQWTLSQAQDYAREVESALRGKEAIEYFKYMYGNQPDTWQDSLSGWERLRTITNYFTRLRFCAQDGKMDFTHKADTAMKGYYPWFEVPNRQTQDHQIVFGHWAALEGQTNTPKIFAIDTGCVWGKCLTALRLEDYALFSVPSKTRPKSH